MKKFIYSLALAVGMMAASAGAWASPTPAHPGCSISDMPGSFACVGGFSGNDVGNSSTLALTASRLAVGYNEIAFDTLLQAPVSGSWSLVEKVDDGKQGNWFFRVPDDADGVLRFKQDLNGIFAITLKAGNGWAGYIFDDFTLAQPTLSLSFTTDGLSTASWDNKKKEWKGKDLSHAALWSFTPPQGFFGDACAINPAACGPTTPIPEPGTLALMLAGLGAVGLIGRRRRV